MNNSDLSLDNLADVVRGKDRRVPRSEAMARLAAADFAGRESLLAQVLENTYEPRRYRANAAIELGRIATSEAERILIDNLQPTDDVFPNVVRSLGSFGGQAALDAINRLDLPPNQSAIDAAAFAATLIAHRHGLSGYELPFPAEQELLEVPANGVQRIEFAPTDSVSVKSSLARLLQHPFGIEVDSTLLTRVRCPGQTHVIALNRDSRGPATEQMLKRKAIPAMVVLQSPESGEYSIAYVVLSRPIDASTVGLMLYRSTGRLKLAGTAVIMDGGLEFELRAVSRPGARAVSLKGTVRDGRVTMTEALSSATAQMRRVPARRIG